jgi:hypothetical protein
MLAHNVRVYDQLRFQGAYLSIYRKITKSSNTRKPNTSNWLYALLYVVLFLEFD